MPPPQPQPKPGAKGKPGGVPIWAWGAAIAVGLIVGFVFLRKPQSAAAEGAPAGPGAPPSSGGGGTIALPPDLLAALGLRPPAGSGGGETAVDDGGNMVAPAEANTSAGDAYAESMSTSTLAAAPAAVYSPAAYTDPFAGTYSDPQVDSPAYGHIPAQPSSSRPRNPEPVIGTTVIPGIGPVASAHVVGAGRHVDL